MKYIFLISQAGSGYNEWVNEIAFTTQKAAREYVNRFSSEIQNYYKIETIRLGD